MKKTLKEFIDETKGTRVDVPWANGKLKGQCVSLVQQYIGQCLEQPMKARGNAVDWIQSYVDEGLGHTTADQKTGDLIVFPHEAEPYGHIAIWVEGKLYDQNNGRHDNWSAGFGEVFSWDFVTLRPNTEVIVGENLLDNVVKAEDIETLAQAVINGEYGNGEERKQKLGVLYDAVQNRVNEIMSAPNIDELAQAVIRGEYGNGQERKDKLGNLYDAVQSRVNELLK